MHIVAIGIKSLYRYYFLSSFAANRSVNLIDYETIHNGPTPTASEEKWNVDFSKKKASFANEIAEFSAVIEVTGFISLKFSRIERFSSPVGLLGTTHRCKIDLSFDCTEYILGKIDFSTWKESNNNLFGHSAVGQETSLFGIDMNIFHQASKFPVGNGYDHETTPALNFVIEGNIFS